MSFSDKDLRKMIVPLFFEQLLVLLVGIADTFMVSYAGEEAVSGVSLTNSFNTIFIYIFTALAAGGAVVTSQYIGREDRDKCGGQCFPAVYDFVSAGTVFSDSGKDTGENIIRITVRQCG